MRLWVRIGLFISSYAPLLLIYGILNVEKYRIAGIILICASIAVGGLLAAYFPLMRHMKPSHPYTIKSVQSREGELLSYVSSYIIPFVSWPFKDWANALAVIVVFIMLCVIYVSSNLIVINPVLSLLRFRLYEVTFAGSDIPRWVVSRSPIVLQRPVPLIELRMGVYLTKARSVIYGDYYPSNQITGE